MKRTHLLPAAYLFDQLAGDPEWLPHPVRIIGHAITAGERALRSPDDGPAREFATGMALAVSIVTSTYFVTRAIIRLAYKQSSQLGNTIELLLAWTCLAAQNLSQEAHAVSAALNRNDLNRARRQLARIVGRDIAHLDAHEISRALIETLAESASDGVVAPLIYLAVGGVPLAMAYKAVNTLDSMIGHRTEQYLYFGKFAARLDDAANFLPARLTAFSTIAAASLLPSIHPHTAWKIWLRDGAKHKSPNAGQPEAAFSGALQIRLGGDNSYDGEIISTPLMGAEFPKPTPIQAAQAIRLVSVVCLFSLAAGILIAALQQRRAATPCP